MAYMSYYDTPDLIDAEFDEYGDITLEHEPGHQRTKLRFNTSTTNYAKSMMFLFRLRYAVDQAIKHYLKEGQSV